MSKHQKASSLENLFLTDSHRVIYAEISALKRRLHLLEGERKANYQLHEEQLKKNETHIQQLREQNQKLKKERAGMVVAIRDNYFELIRKNWDSKKNVFEFKGKGFEETKDILECKIGDTRNKLNILAFKKNQIRQDIKKVIQKEYNLMKISSKENGKNGPSMSEEIKEIENKIAEMKIKVTEGENLQIRYKNMLSTLTTSNLAKLARISQVEADILHESKEIVNLRKTLTLALQVKKDSKVQLAQMEEETLAAYGKREQSLFEARINLKEIHEKMEAIGAKLTYPKFHMIHRDSSLTEGLIVGYDGSRIRMSDEMKSQNVIEKVYNQLQEMTGESDPVLIVKRYQQQREHSGQLKWQLEEASSEVRKCKLRKRFLEDKLRNLQYSGGLERKALDDEYDEIKTEYDSISDNKHDMERNIKNYEQLLEEMHGKLNGVCLVVGLDIPEIEIMDTSEKVVEMLKLLYSQLEEMIQTKEIAFVSPLVSPVEKEFGSEHESLVSATGSVGAMSNYFFGSEMNRLSDMSKMTDFDSSLLSPELNMGRSISMPKLDHMVDSPQPPRSPAIKSLGKKSDSSDDEDAVGRNYIKRQSQILVEAKTRKGRFNAAIAITARPRNF